MGNSVVKTPNIDRIAQSGVRFNSAFVNNPLCMPSRSTLFNGLTPRSHGVRTNGIPLDPKIPTMTEALRQAGYRTHGVGKIHLNSFGLPKGLDPEKINPLDHPESRYMWSQGKIKKLPEPYYGLETIELANGHGSYIYGDYLNWLKEKHPDAVSMLDPKSGTPSASKAEQLWKMPLPEELHVSKWIGDKAISFLENEGAKKPFFLWCSFPDPHHPYCAPQPWADMYDPADVQMPNRREGELESLPPHYKKIFEESIPLSGRSSPTKMSDEQIRDIIAMTYGMISLVDHHIGRILDMLQKLDLRKKTVIVFMSDHGDMMGDHWIINKGPFHFDGLVRVPFLWSWQDHFEFRMSTNALVSLLDFAPTILDLAGVPIPEGNAPAVPEASNMLPPWAGNSIKPILTGKESSVQDSVLVENDEDYLGLRLRTIITKEYKMTVYPGQTYGELFYRQNDPCELKNLWDDPDYQKIKQELYAKLLEKIIMTDNRLPRRICHA